MKIAKPGMRKYKCGNRVGSASVEAALILPVLIIITLGSIDVSQYIHMSEVISNASREAARIASRDTTDSVSDVEDAITQYFGETFPQMAESELASALSVVVRYGQSNLSGSLDQIETGDSFSVIVDFDFDSIRWLPGLDYWNGESFEVETVCRRE